MSEFLVQHTFLLPSFNDKGLQFSAPYLSAWQMGLKSLVKLLFDLVIGKARQQIDSIENRKLFMNTMLEFMGNFSMLTEH